MRQIPTRDRTREMKWVARNRAAFAARYVNKIPVGGLFSGELSNAGQLIRFERSDGSLLGALIYNTTDPWPSAADGASATLHQALIASGRSRAVHVVAPVYRYG